MLDQVNNKITIDEYVAKMGKDKDIVTVTFTTYSEQAAEDLVSWFERGYDFILDASISEGELEPGKYLVFIELKRRSSVPERICQLLSDLETLTGFKPDDWSVNIDGDDYEADTKIIAKHMVLNPNVYKEEKMSEEETKAEEESEKKAEKEANVEGTDTESTEELPSEPNLNEYRSLAGLDIKTKIGTTDEYIRQLKSMAGL